MPPDLTQVRTGNSTMQLAERISRLGTESAFEVLVRARALEKAGRNVVHLEIGEPDFPTPDHIVEAGRQALADGWTKYGPAAGLPELREAVAHHISASRGIPVEPENVCVVPGGKPIMFFSMMALLEPGDEVIFPDPGFPIYESMIRFLGARPVSIPLIEERGFSFDLDRLRTSLSDKTKMIVLISPGNPTGGVIPREDIEDMASLIRNRDLMVLSDEIYSRIWYETPPFSIASCEGMQEKTIILDGFSKTYSMTGWRLGYGVMPVWLVDAVARLMVNSNSCTAAFTQRAGLAALTGPQDSVTTMVAQLKRRRDTIVDGLNGISGFRCSSPAGAFYAFANIRDTGISCQVLADRLLNEAGVACLSGTGFGQYGDGYVRFSYANSLEKIEEAIARVRQFSETWA